MAGKTEVTIGMNPEFLRAVQNAAKAGVRDTFKAIRTDAQERSPKATGDNADSIAVKVRSYPGKVSASIFTQSGYGGYLERGTSKMAPEPYIFPAVEAGLANLGENVRARLEEFSQGNVTPIPDELIGDAVSKLKSKHDKGAGIIGGKAHAGKTSQQYNRKKLAKSAWLQYVAADPSTRGDWLDFRRRHGGG